MRKQLLALLSAASATGACGCTEQLPSSFRFAQQEQSFSSEEKVNTKIDLLWVVDNSASMDINQEKLRKGFTAFAEKYLQPDWDIRVAVITTDTYMAHASFQNYLDTTISGSVAWKSTHIQSRLGTFVNPTWSPDLVNLQTGKFDGGIKYGELIPNWGPSFGQLLPGLHDGPITALCSELLPYFLRGVTQCATRDLPSGTTTVAEDIERCVNPNADNGESSLTHCVNTIQNDTIHSGKPILETLLTDASIDPATWTQQLIRDFTVNVSAGSAGQGSERGISSLLQLLSDNEPSETAFFRPDSLRGIIFVSDEDDQSMTIPAAPESTFKPQTYYKCDQETLLSMNPTSWVTGTSGACCTGATCQYGSEGTSCPSKTVDDHTYTITVCPREDLLIPIAEVKNELDSFFYTLDGQDSETASAEDVTANYFVVSIVPLTGESIIELQALRAEEDATVKTLKTVAVDRGDRYLALGEAVGNGSLEMDIAEEDYSPILDAIGAAIIEKKSTFHLSRAPTGEEDMIVKIQHADGSATAIPSDKYVISGKSIYVNDSSLILGLASTDSIVINYQPKTAF